MHIIVGSVTCCSAVLKTDTGCLIIEQVFRGKVSECMLHIGANSGYQKSASNNPSCTDDTSHTNLPTCIDTLWTNMRKLLFWEFQYRMKWNQTSPLNRISVSSALYPKNIAIHKLQSCFINFVPEFANHSCLMLMVMQQLYCISCWWFKKACWLCQLGPQFVCRCLKSSTSFT